jgi:cell division protein ZapA (FtsZ GTPase activity inhibitor)
MTALSDRLRTMVHTDGATIRIFNPEGAASNLTDAATTLDLCHAALTEIQQRGQITIQQRVMVDAALTALGEK